jgi:hypothetical protein
MYKKCFDPITQSEAKCIMRIEDGAIIPFDEANVDYIIYMNWLSEGNIPEPWEASE